MNIQVNVFQEVEILLKAGDLDNDGQLDYEEFMSLMSPNMSFITRWENIVSKCKLL